MQKLLTLIITIAILYTIVQVKMKDTPSESSTHQNTTASNSNPPSQNNGSETIPMAGNALEKTLSSVLLNVLKTEHGRSFLENIIQPANKPIAGSNYSFKINNTELLKAMFKIRSFGHGTKGPALCGHIVTVHYQILNDENTVIKEETKTFTLGTQNSAAGLNMVIPGMKTGETRQAVLPSKYQGQPENTEQELNVIPYYKLNVTLNEILPNVFIGDNDVKVYDDEISYKLPLVCGNIAHFDAKITKLSNGQVLYDSESSQQKINMRIGDLTFPALFSYALHGKVPVGTRTVIAKGSTFNSLGSVKINKIFPKEQLPNNEYFMLELKNFD